MNKAKIKFDIIILDVFVGGPNCCENAVKASPKLTAQTQSLFGSLRTRLTQVLRI